MSAACYDHERDYNESAWECGECGCYSRWEVSVCHCGWVRQPEPIKHRGQLRLAASSKETKDG